VTWETRLARIIHHPSFEEVVQFFNNKVAPALNRVEKEFAKRGLEAVVSRDDNDRIWIEVNHGDEVDFFYSVHARPYTPPTFIMRDTTTKRGKALRYFRAEVY